MQPWAPEMHSKAQKGFITKAELSCRLEYVRVTSHKAAEYSLFLIVYFFSKASLLSELLGVQSGENENGDLQKCKMCSWFWARRAFKPIQMRSRPSTSRHGADKSAALWEKKRWWSWWRCWWWWTWMDVWLAIAGLALQVWHHLRNRQIPNHQRLRRSRKWWGMRMTQVWTLMIDNRTQSFCPFVLPWNFSLSTETTEKVFLAGLPCLGLTIS